MAAEMVRTEKSGSVHVIVLENPRVNALCVGLLEELEAAVAGIVAEEPRAVVLHGGPKVFAAGADIGEFAQRGGSAPFELSGPPEVARIGSAFHSALNAVASLPCPTIAAINGFALGGGCELALACDFRVAAGDARLGQPEILLGIIPGGGGTQRLARLVGPARAKDLIFSGRMIDAEEARGIGLVDQVVEGDALTAAMELAARYASGPREATALAKKAIDRGLDGSLRDGLALEQTLFVESFATGDALTGVASFLESGPGHAEFG